MKKLKETTIGSNTSHQTVQPKLVYNAPLFVLIDINKTGAKPFPQYPEQSSNGVVIGS